MKPFSSGNGLMGWLGVQSWDSLTTEERVDAHERFTRSFERYLMEGKAPVRGLEGLFQQVQRCGLKRYTTELMTLMSQ